MRRILSCGTAALALSLAVSAHAQDVPEWRSAEAEAQRIVESMRPDEKTLLTSGIMPLPFGSHPVDIPADAVPGAGYVPGIPRLGIPALKETDASLGVSYVMGLRKDGATALPSGVAMAAGWDPTMMDAAGAMIGGEARAKGFNVLLAGGVNLMRDPRNGRTFEYLSEDPLLTGTLAGASIRGIQSNNMISTIKHFALNGQETGRKFVVSKISEAAARESDLLAFQIGIEQGRPGAVMCAYNRVRDGQACASRWLLNDVLKRDWRYKGFVMSDWGAVPGVDAAIAGLDQQSGAQLDAQHFFAAPLAAEAAKDPAYAARLDDMNRRIVTAIRATGVDRNLPVKPVDMVANAKVAQQVAERGIVLLRNRGDALPLAANVKRIAVIGGYADVGVLSGGGSSQVQGQGGAAAIRPGSGGGAFSQFASQQYHRSSPVAAIKALAPDAIVTFRDGRYIADAVEQARGADIAIVFATQWTGEGFDLPDLSLPDGQDALIAAVADANRNTLVVLETGGPLLMPWLDKTAAVIEAWFPGARGGEAIANVLFGKVNPGGRLPVTFPASTADLPRPKLDGADRYEPDFAGNPPTPDAEIVADYDIEGADVGYRWNARSGRKALFPFGYGLSYTRFSSSSLKTDGRRATLTVRNEGARAGATVAQLYLVSRDGVARQRLVGFERVELAPGEAREVSLAIDPRLLADWTEAGWTIAGGNYAFALGEDAEHLSTPVTVRLRARRWRD